MTTPYYSDDAVTLYHGDCLDLLAELEISIDAVVMDPPYASGTRAEASKSSSGAMLRAGRFADKPIENDQMTTVGFVWLMRMVAQGCRDALVDGGSLLSFIDWRQWPNLVGALESCNYRVQGMVVWDKGSMGLGNGFRAQHELICHASKGVPTVVDRGVGNVLSEAPVDAVFRHPREAAIDHPSPKPVGLMERLIGTVTAPGDLILDAFAGSGSTLVAAKATGRRAIGFESIEAHCETTARRLTETLRFSPVMSSSPPALDFGGAP
jgi:site-specific DNA-methyltransferase (adenine-specific)